MAKKKPSRQAQPADTSVSAEDKAILDEAHTRLADAISRESEERAKAKVDIRFVALEQWDQKVRAQREGDVNGARPCLTIDKLGQYRMQILNDIRKNRPAVKVRPVDSGADVETADIFQGITRHIEDISSADIAYQAAAEWAIDAGAGYFRFTTDYVDQKSRNQEIYVKPIFDGFSVYLGPHLMPDGSDAEYGFVLEDVPLATFRREHPGAKDPTGTLDGDTSSPFWVGEESVRKAEYFYFKDTPAKLLYLSDGTDVFEDEYAEMVAKANMDDFGVPIVPTVMDSRESFKRSVKWCKLTATEILDKRDWAGKYIPIVKVVGHQKMVDGKKLTWGLIRPAIDSARMYNYFASTVTERIMQSPATPYIAAEGQIAGREQEWKEINRSRLSVVQYKPIDVSGNAVPPPERVMPAPMEQAMIHQLLTIEHDIQTSLGMFKASVGDTQSDQSGIAIRSLQMQSDTATFNFPDNLALSIRHGGRIMIDLIPKIKDVEQVIRILGPDGKAKRIQIDPNQKQSMREIPTQEGKVKRIYNLGVGTYDVTVTVGPSFTTKRMESVAIMQEAMKGNPQLTPLIGDLLFKQIDSPIADEISERLKRALPQQLQGDDEDEPPVPPKAQAKIMQMTQQMQMMNEKGQELAQENMKLKSGEASALAKINVQREEALAALELEKEVQDKKIALERSAALEKARLEREIAEAEHGLAKEKIAFERDQKLAADPNYRDVAMLPQVVEGMQAMTQAVAGAIGELANLQKQALALQEQTLAVLQNPPARSVLIGNVRKDGGGNIVGADVATRLQ